MVCIRLAFSVGVHLDSDILILDEILAVGDDSFQKKFTRQIEHIIKQGKTILIVSHSDEIIMRFCDKAMLLINGQVKDIGPTAQTLALYHEMCK
jgi:ABC-type polysaccharide/polyol phosphate transport system ATPase subunit